MRIRRTKIMIKKNAEEADQGQESENERERNFGDSRRVIHLTRLKQYTWF